MGLNLRRQEYKLESGLEAELEYEVGEYRLRSRISECCFHARAPHCAFALQPLFRLIDGWMAWLRGGCYWSLSVQLLTYAAPRMPASRLVRVAQRSGVREHGWRSALPRCSPRCCYRARPDGLGAALGRLPPPSLSPTHLHTYPLAAGDPPTG